MHFRTNSNQKRGSPVQEVWETIGYDQADFGYGLLPSALREKTSQKNQNYTGCDGFCGAGCATAGAKSASINVKWSFDNNPAAITTYKENNNEVTTYVMDCFDVLQSFSQEIQPDILLLSFPCQRFSPAHTTPGKNDEMNEAVMLSLSALLSKLRPRLVVIEQTLGYDYAEWRNHMNTTITQFLENGYSVRKAVINLASYGLCTLRKRLIFIGAA